MADKMLRLPAVQELVGLSRSTIYDMISRKEFPKPVRLGRRAVAWPSSRVEDWIDQRSGREAA